MSEHRLVFLHGFTQTHHHWHECASLIGRASATTTTLAFVDLPGHGLSSADRLSIEDAAPALVRLAGRGTYIGYSMGARHALAAACGGSPEIERLVLVGGTAGLADAAARTARIAEDEARADRIVAIGVEQFVDEWLAQPLFAGLPVTDADREHRLRNTADGLASSLRLAGTGAQRSFWNSVADVTIPVLVLAGEYDAKFIEIGRRLTERIPNATMAAIPNAGHAAHAEQPVAAAALITEWLIAQPSASPTVSSAP